MPLPTDYTDATTPTGATTELPATTTRGVNAITTQINTNTTAITGHTNYLNGTTSGATLTAPNITGYVETVQALGTVGTGTTTLSLATGTFLTATLTASQAHTWTMPTATGGTQFSILVKQAASTGGGTVTFTGVKWPTQGTPTMSATAGKADLYSFIADGTSWYGSYIQGYTY